MRSGPPLLLCGGPFSFHSTMSIGETGLTPTQALQVHTSHRQDCVDNLQLERWSSFGRRMNNDCCLSSSCAVYWGAADPVCVGHRDDFSSRIKSYLRICTVDNSKIYPEIIMHPSLSGLCFKRGRFYPSKPILWDIFELSLY